MVEVIMKISLLLTKVTLDNTGGCHVVVFSPEYKQPQHISHT